MKTLMAVCVCLVVMGFTAREDSDTNTTWYEEPTTQKDHIIASDILAVRTYAKEHKVRCRSGMTGCTLMGCGGDYYNESGEYVPYQDCNYCTTIWFCDDGKTFSVRE